MARLETVAHEASNWFALDTQVNAEATATKAALSGMRHYLTGISISMSAAPAAAVSVLVKSGTTTIDRLELPANAQAPLVINFPRPYRALAENELLSVTLPALGGGVRGSVTIRGFTDRAG